MDEIAEQGFAAHWKYKEGEDAEYTEDENELNEWLRTIKEILDDPQPDAMDFLDAIKLNLFASEIFVFTPKGEIKTMPTGCTALDFAFSIHTFLGSHCIGAKVNHKLVPLSHKLQSGDQVEILTSKSQHVQPSWINFVSTAKAKAKIQAILRRNNREQQKQGEEMFHQFLQKNGIEDSLNAADQLAEFHEVRNREYFFQALAEKTLVPFLGRGKDSKRKLEDKGQEFFVVTKDFNRKKPVFISDENINQYKFKHCCHPIPGDDILGFIDGKRQIEIHKRDCPIAAKLKASFGNRILDAKWDMQKKLHFDAVIRLEGIDRVGMLLDISKIISSQMNVNIHKLTIASNDGVFDGTVEMRVFDRENVQEIMDKLKTVDGLQEVTQIM